MRTHRLGCIVSTMDYTASALCSFALITRAEALLLFGVLAVVFGAGFVLRRPPKASRNRFEAGVNDLRLFVDLLLAVVILPLHSQPVRQRPGPRPK